MTYKIVKAQCSHVPEILAIERALFSVPWSADNFISEIENSDACCLAVVSESGQVLGFGILHCFGFEAELFNIAVAPDKRRLGLGRAMLEAILKEARERQVEKVFLEVRVSNAPARGLYGATGFAEVGLRKNYYDKPTEDAIIMAKTLY